MASLEDALKKAGLQANEADTPAGDAPKASAPKASSGKAPAAPAAPLEERPCTKCGTVFMPKLAKHRLCPKCAEEHFTASKDKPAGEKGEARPPREKPVAASGESKPPHGPRPERRERPPRPPQAARPAGEAAPRETPREPRREQPRREQAPQREAPQGFPRDYLQSGYFVGNVMRDELFDTWARHVAGLLVSRGLNANQLRAFYSHVKRADDSAKAGRDFKEVREEILKMRPVAAARQGRKLIPSEFADFLDRNIEQIKDARTLGAFVEHFQGVVGYTAGRLKK